jgi:hypothetical protein
MKSSTPTPIQSRDTIAGKQDRPWELMGQSISLPNGTKCRVIGFSPFYESDVIVGIIDGSDVLHLTTAPTGRLLRRGGKVVGFLLDAHKDAKGIECHYETYSKVLPRASGPIRRELMEAGCDLPQLRARMELLYSRARLPEAIRNALANA